MERKKNMNEISFESEKSGLAAAKLYEPGWVSSGRAAELAGMTRVGVMLAVELSEGVTFESEFRVVNAAVT